MPSRFIAEKNETERVTGLEQIEGEPLLTAEQIHQRHLDDLAKMDADDQEDQRDVEYPEDEDTETKPGEATGEAERGKRG